MIINSVINANNLMMAGKKGRRKRAGSKPPRIPRHRSVGEVDLTYKNRLGEPLKSTPNPNFREDLIKAKNTGRISGIKNVEKATERISSLSRYLKEEMIGFVVPEYTLEKKNKEKKTAQKVEKGGYEWFGHGLQYLLEGSRKNVKPEQYEPVAKELFGLLSIHDPYWTSKEFSDYLQGLKTREKLNAKQIAAIDGTRRAIEPKSDLSFGSSQRIEMYGYFSPMKAMDKILDGGCAYSGTPLVFEVPTKGKREIIPPEYNASLDHIVPKEWGGLNDDANYFVTSAKINSDRDHMTLLAFLKGRSAPPKKQQESSTEEDYLQFLPNENMV